MDGKLYGIFGTDTRYLLQQEDLRAGRLTDWQPKNWDEILSARTIKEKVPGVIPTSTQAPVAK